MAIIIGGAAALATALGMSITALIVTALTVLSGVLAIIAQITRSAALRMASLIVGAAAIVYQFGVIAVHVISLHGFSLMSVGRILVYGVRAFINNVSFGLKSILGAIRFDIALKVHRIAYILSNSYRKRWQRIEGNLAEVSQALNWGAAGLTLFFRDARNLVFNVSGLFGRGFDLAEVQWMKTLDRFLRDYRRKFGTREISISRITFWLDKWITRPYQDAQRDYMGSVVATIESVLNWSEAVIEDVVTIRNDFEALLSDLPASIRNEIMPYIENVLETFDQVMDDYIAPRLSTINDIVDVLRDDRDRLEGNLNDLAGRLALPGSYLYEIESFAPGVRIIEEDLVGEVAFAPFRDTSGLLSGIADEEWSEWSKIVDAAAEQRTPPSWKVTELEAPSRPARTKAEPRTTWFVGDY